MGKNIENEKLMTSLLPHKQENIVISDLNFILQIWRNEFITVQREHFIVNWT
jgi:hypothetical protein